MGPSRRVKPPLFGEAKLALVGWEEESMFLALGVLFGLDLLGTVAKSQRPKRGPSVSLASVWLVNLIVICIKGGLHKAY